MQALRLGEYSPRALCSGSALEAGEDGRRGQAAGGAKREASRGYESPLQGDPAQGARGEEERGRQAGWTVSDAEARRAGLVELYREVSNCALCPLAETRTKTVFGAGNANAQLMFVGEAPGAEEDRQGLPFVGRAGQLLSELLGEIDLSREDVFIANVLKSRPPGNRDPMPGEIEACQPYLWKQIALIQPIVIATLGNFATKLLSGNPTGITRVRGVPQVHELGGRTVFLFPLLHPAAALRTPAMKVTLREDFAKLPALLAEALPQANEPDASLDPADQLDLFG